MKGWGQRRVSRAALWARRIAVFSVLLLVISCLGHRYRMIETIPFFWLAGVVAVLALLALALAAYGFHRLWEYGDKAGKASLAASVLALAVLAPYGVYGGFALRHPALTDITTDLIDPPHFTQTPSTRTGEMNLIRPATERERALHARDYPHVAGRRFDASMERVLSALGPVLAAHGWTPRRALPRALPVEEYTFEAEAPTYWLRIPADAAFRLVEEDDQVFVDMRLNWRYGRHDLGDGARRIEAFMAALDAEFARQSLEIIDIPPGSEGPGASTGEEDAVD